MENNRNNKENSKRPAPKRRKIRTAGYTVNVICLVAVAAVFLTFTFLNVFAPTRDTVSMTEKRELAKFPEFSFGSLFDGSFFSGLQSYVSDHFWQRERLVDLSSSLEKLNGFAVRMDGKEFIPVGPGEGEIDTGEDTDLIGLLSNLTLPVTDPPTEPVTSDGGTSAPPETSGPDVTSDAPVTTLSPDRYTSLVLSKTSAEVLAGGSITLTATEEHVGNAPEPLEWSAADGSIISLSVSADGTGATVEALKAGETTVTCRAGDITASCRIKVTAIDVRPGDPNAVEFLQTGGYFIYGKSAYVTATYSATQAKVAESYRATAEYYKQLFPNTRVSVMVIPTSAAMLTDKAITDKFADQGEILSKMAALYKDSPVNFVNVYNTFMLHRNEYLYLRTDHHWNGRGAYYAYSDFVSSVGLVPTPIEAFEYHNIHPGYVGSIYNYNKDTAAGQKVKEFADDLEAYLPTKECTMKITRTDGKTTTYKMAIFNYLGTNGGIASFIGGDNPLTVINVPDNPQDRSILILKDSYADQFTPFLIENYGNIYVVDPRYNATTKLYDQFRDVELDDILFMNNLQVANSAYWAKAYLRLVGVQ